MKLILNSSRHVVTWDTSYITINGKKYASFDASSVTTIFNNTCIGRIYRSQGDTYGTSISNNSLLIRSNLSDYTLRNSETDEVLASFEGTPTGAVASYLAFIYFSKHRFRITPDDVMLKDTYVTQDVSKPHRRIENKEFKILERQFESPIKQPIEPPVERPTEPPTMVHKREPIEPPRIFVPTSSQTPSESNTGCGCIAGILGIIGLFVAISMIPQSWEDLGKYIPAGDSGITICFFSSLIGGILAVLIAVIAKKPSFISCMKAFLSACTIGIIINAIILLSEGVEFTGFFLFDIPLSIFAPILGCFQFALPIGIAAALISGIVCAVKKD